MTGQSRPSREYARISVRSFERRAVTAEIAILNREAVALAADSMAAARGIEKAYSTARKIFPISADPPVAVMVYGGGTLGPLPY